MTIHIKDLRRQYDGSQGDHLVITLGPSMETQVIIDTDPSEQDIRVSDGTSIYKLTFDDDYTVQHAYKDDVYID